MAEANSRILSLDILRGLTVALMIVVNNPGTWDAIYPPLMHASWHGLTPTDLVFPFFLFIVGVSIVYSLEKAIANKVATKILFFKIAKRAIILFSLGLFLNLFPAFEFSSVRIPGVLQRIGVVFFFSALCYLYLSKKSIYILIGIILIGYYLLMCFVPIPNGLAANLEPATNIGAWIDNLLLQGHLWAHSKVWDPEGLVSTLPAIVSGLIGVATGIHLKNTTPIQEKLLQLIIVAQVMIVIALTWNMVFPINKSLWTSSFVLITSGIALQALVFCYWLVDLRKVNIGNDLFLAFGSNAISAYMLSELLANLMYNITFTYQGKLISLKGFFYDVFAFDGVDPRFTSLLLALLWAGIVFMPIYVLYRKKIFIKV